MNNSSLSKKVFHTINKNYLFENKPKVAVGVSGGPDSIALVFILREWIKNKKGNLIALIVDHQLRKNSYLEAKEVKNFLNHNKIKSVILRVSKKKVINKKMKEARENRFYKMSNYCLKNNILHLFLAHHQDDNIETFLLRKIAGSNLEGLSSIKLKSSYRNIQILRPMLNIKKNQLIKFNTKYGLRFLNDPTNLNKNYSRPFVRNFLITNSKITKNIKEEFKIVNKNYQQYKKMIFQIYHLVCEKNYKKKVIFNKNKFFGLNIELQSKLIELVYKFLYPKKHFIRYKKLYNFLKRAKKQNTYKEIVSSIKIDIGNKYIKFSVFS